MAIEIFNRVEYKYVVNSAQYERILSLINQHMTVDEYNADGRLYTISNLYFDTDDHLYIRRSLDKPEYKEKLRLRAYGVPKPDDKVYFGIKKKYKGVVNKRRTALTLSQAYDFALNNKLPEPLPYVNMQVVHEIEYFMKRYSLKPKVYIAYDRLAYFGNEDHGLRISFDTNIRTRRYDLKLELGDYGEPLIDDDLRIMEIKAHNAMPLWLAHGLSEISLKRQSFSKYGTEYQKYIKERNEKCLILC